MPRDRLVNVSTIHTRHRINGRYEVIETLTRSQMQHLNAGSSLHINIEASDVLWLR